ncbi:MULTISPECIES: DUF3631 domain-containing protein [unclassified Mycolicibacterium]|uniref:DUF3631 domain-containing protein n=1 Tax=unclassified Mycolicibacterium TaxID=2636767 RepID=UPI001BB4318D|nr:MULTISPECIES: DUF3631 domain-containing protein [unclassified Mycolicibacterium]
MSPDRAADPPAGVTDRSAEIWEPMIAIADLAGGGWPDKARAACRFFVIASASDDERLSLGQRLLRDIKTVYDEAGTNAMWSSDIIAKLTSDAESEWRDMWGKTLDQRRLAKELARYGVKSKTVRVGVATSRGYDIEGTSGLKQAWDHWLTPSASDTSATADTSQVTAFRSVSNKKMNDTSDTQATQRIMTPELHVSENVSDVSDVSLTCETSRPGRPPLCPDCARAPARSDSHYCDLCTARRRRQQTMGDTPVTAAQWLVSWIRENADSDGWVKPGDALAAGEAAGHNRAAVIKARQIYAEPPIESSGIGRRSMWRIVRTDTQTTNRGDEHHGPDDEASA